MQSETVLPPQGDKPLGISLYTNLLADRVMYPPQTTGVRVVIGSKDLVMTEGVIPDFEKELPARNFTAKLASPAHPHSLDGAVHSLAEHLNIATYGSSIGQTDSYYLGTIMKTGEYPNRFNTRPGIGRLNKDDLVYAVTNYDPKRIGQHEKLLFYFHPPGNVLSAIPKSEYQELEFNFLDYNPDIKRFVITYLLCGLPWPIRTE